MARLARLTTGRKSGVMVVECSQPGFDVLTCAPHQMLFSSLVDVISAIEVGSVSVSNGGSVLVPFSLGGVPFVTFQIVSGSPATAIYPSMFQNEGNVWGEIDGAGITFRNTSGASRVVNYQIWNRRLV